MSVKNFEEQLAAACETLFATATPDSVAIASSRIAKLIVDDPQRQAVQYCALRDLVEAAARGDVPHRYTLLVALHDTLLRERAFSPPGSDPSYLLFFDEAFYLAAHEDIGAAVRAGACRSGFAHFVEYGAREGRRGHPWRATGRGLPTPKVVPAEGVGSWGRKTAVANAGRDAKSGDKSGAKGFGINLIAFHSANLGLGVSARHYYRYLIDAGFAVCPVDVPVPGGRSGHDMSYADRFAPLECETPHAVNLFLMNPRDIHDHLAMRYPALRTEGRVNVALPFWELARLPESWLPTLSQMDIVLAASGFIRHAMAMDLSGPLVRSFAHPIYLSDRVRADRRRWQIPDRAVAFVCSFEMASDVNRKNPFAGIRAFERALGADPRALLIVKVNNAKWHEDFAPHLDELRAIAKRAGNVRIMDEVLPYHDVLSLFASCDALVSLHRAEGLGLCLMEAMTLGKPVIATGWSGNMDFTTEQNSCLVGYDLVPVVNSTQAAYSSSVVRSDATWAEARVDEAAHWMRRLVQEPGLRARIGDRAAADMADYQRRIDAGELIATVQNLLARRGAAANPAATWRS